MAFSSSKESSFLISDPMVFKYQWYLLTFEIFGRARIHGKKFRLPIEVSSIAILLCTPVGLSTPASNTDRMQNLHSCLLVSLRSHSFHVYQKHSKEINVNAYLSVCLSHVLISWSNTGTCVSCITWNPIWNNRVVSVNISHLNQVDELN